ncbi:isoprenylcysteine carboxylmethyltransferase family protein [Mariprofundus sp. KV]|nr:isoprenylcysteine carboxylmethyltransferase family protein [Mariprofundus sp. KV]
MSHSASWGGLLFGAAGTMSWPEAWAYLAVQFCCSSYMTIWLQRHDPALLKSRMSYFKPGISARDKLFGALLALFYIPFLMLPGLDAVRFGWSDVPWPLEFVGLLAVVVGMWLILLVMQVNSFASPIVEVQRERDHQVIDSGPYACVRHPMYTGFVAIMFAIPLALGSLWGFVPALLMALSLSIRIRLEEQMLNDELEGYSDYCLRVRFRLVPGLW